MMEEVMTKETALMDFWCIAGDDETEIHAELPAHTVYAMMAGQLQCLFLQNDIDEARAKLNDIYEALNEKPIDQVN